MDCKIKVNILSTWCMSIAAHGTGKGLKITALCKVTHNGNLIYDCISALGSLWQKAVLKNIHR